MINPTQLIKEMSFSKNALFNSFHPNSNYNFEEKEFKKYKKFKTVIIIGMGGSILGAKAIHSFLKHKIKKKFIFLDNLDQNYLRDIKKKIDSKKTLFIIISKSGNTNETLVNLSYFKKQIKNNNTIVITEKKNSNLFKFAKKNKVKIIEHSSEIGGRYSVFSDVGMLPAYLMGLKPSNFKKKLSNYFKNKKNISSSVRELYRFIKNKKKVLIFFNYIPELNDFLFWCQQLLAESLGKNKKGFIPVISEVPKDHHSLLQLYLDGPPDKFFYIFSLKKRKSYKLNFKFFDKNLSYLNNKTYEQIKNSQKQAFINVLIENKIPYRKIIIKNFDESTLGNLFYMFILETIILGKVFNVNPFDQPAVEKVKILTKKNLTLKKFS
tara:strand:+ start:1964 stop:3100 length:1137 start_codon:yes stop_codon:yes gene_type:complete